MNGSQSCGNCIFTAAVKGPAGDSLICRRNPPVPLMQMIRVQPTPQNPDGVATAVVGYQSPVNAGTWCGEWAEKPAPNLAAT